MRVNYVKKATGSKKRPWPEEGKTCMKCRKPILKGEPYKWAKGRYSSKRIACGNCSFSRSDLTDSIKAGIYSAFEDAATELENADESTDFESIRDQIAEAIREVEQQYRDTSEEYFSGGGPQAEMADECDSAASEVESIDLPDIEEFEAWVEANRDELEVQTFEEWKAETDALVDAVTEGPGLSDDENRELYEEYVEGEMREPYDEYVQEKVGEFRDAIEGADTL